MRIKNWCWALLIVSVFADGCSGSTAKQDGSAPDSAGKNQNSKGDAVSAEKVLLPQELVSDATKAIGLLQTQSITYSTKSSTGQTGETTRTIRLEKNDKGEYIVHCTWTGQLAVEGDEFYKITKDGLLEFRALDDDIKPPYIYLPAGMTPGKTWKSTYGFDNAKTLGKVSLEQTAKIAGTEKVTVPMGTYDAVVLEETSKMTGAQFSINTHAKTWFAMNVGFIQSKIEWNGTKSDAAGKKQPLHETLEFKAVKMTKEENR